MIKHILFDIGGVLLNIDPQAALQYWSDCTDLSVDTIRFHFPHEAHDRLERGIISDKNFFRAMKDGLPKPNCLKEEDFWRGWNKLIVDETKTVELIYPLKQKYKVYLLSNTNPRHIQYEVNERFSFQKNVDRSFYSYDLGLRKPEKEIYINVLEIIGARPNECLFIDDALENIMTAQEMGFSVILYKDHEQCVSEFEKLALLN